MTPTASKEKAGHLLAQVPAVVPTCEEKNMTSIAQPTDTVEGEERPHEQEHYPWCVPDDCFLAEYPGAGYNHWGPETNPDIVVPDGCVWRDKPEGHPEITVRAADLDGNPIVEVNAGHNATTMSTSGSIGVSWLTPAEARELATFILAAADFAEREVTR